MSDRDPIPAAGRPVEFDSERKQLALEEYRATMGITFAAKAAGVSLATIRRHLKSDLEFAEAWAEADRAYLDVLREEARRRAVDGYIETEIRDAHGNLTKQVRKHSDGLLTLLLKSKGREEFDQAQRIETKDTTEEDTRRLDPAELNHEQKHLMRKLLRRASQGAASPEDTPQ